MTKGPTAAEFCGSGALRVAVAVGLDGRLRPRRSNPEENAADLQRYSGAVWTGLRLGARDLSPKRRERGEASGYSRREAEPVAPAERRPGFGAKPGGATKYPWPDLRIYRRSGHVALAMRHQMYMGASVIQKGRARDMAVRVAHGPVAPIFRHPAPEQGGAPPSDLGLTCGGASRPPAGLSPPDAGRRAPPRARGRGAVYQSQGGAPPNEHGLTCGDASRNPSGTRGATKYPWLPELEGSDARAVGRRQRHARGYGCRPP